MAAPLLLPAEPEAATALLKDALAHLSEGGPAPRANFGMGETTALHQTWRWHSGPPLPESVIFSHWFAR